MTRYSNVDKYWQVIGLQCEALILQADELIRVGNQLMGPFEKDDIRNSTREKVINGLG